MMWQALATEIGVHMSLQRAREETFSVRHRTKGLMMVMQLS